MNKRHYILVSGLILGLFAVVGTGLVGVTHDVTADRIADNERKALLRKLNQIVPHSQYDNDLLTTTLEIAPDNRLGQHQPTTVYVAMREKEVSAMIFPVRTLKGYSGEIRLLVGINVDGTLAGVRVVSHHETPGLGDSIEIERNDWILDFNGKSLTNPDEDDWKVKRDGGDFDQFTGATITPRAVVQAVHLCLVYFDRHSKELLAQFERQHPELKAEDEEPEHESDHE